MCGLIAKCRKLKLPVDISIKLFNSVVKPIILYGCEIWSFSKNDSSRQISIEKSTTSVMIRGETESYPMSCDITYRVLTFCLRLVQTTKSDKMFLSNKYSHPWISYVKSSLDNIGLSFIFE